MTLWDGVGLGVAALLVFWGIGAYNRLMQLRNKISEAFAMLDQHLQTRSRLITQLVNVLHPELVMEQATFDALLVAQTECDAATAAVRAKPAAPDNGNNPVSQLAVTMAVQAAALTRLLSLLEQHPELRGRADIDPLLDELKLTERQRSFARQVFNEAVRVYNEAVYQFPTRVLASLYGFKDARSL